MGHFLLLCRAPLEEMVRTAVWSDVLLQTVNSGRYAGVGWVPEMAFRARLRDLLSHSPGMLKFLN